MNHEKRFRTVLLSLLLSLFFTPLIAQNTISINATRVKSVVKRILLNTTPQQFDYFQDADDYGLRQNTLVKEIVRTVFRVTIPGDIPDGAQIVSVELVYTTSATLPFTLYQIDNCPNSLSLSEAYTILDNANSLRTFYSQRSTQEATTSLPGLISVVTNSLPGGRTIALGVRCLNEDSGSNVADFNTIQLKIKYNKPVNITVNSNYTACSNIVNDTIRSSGYVLPTKENNSVSLAAFEPQGISSEYIWNDTEVSDQKSKWVRSKNGNDVDKTQNINYSFATILDDDGAAYVANYRIIRNVTLGITSLSGNLSGKLLIDNVSTDVPNITKKVTGGSITVSVVNTSFSVGAGTWLNFTFDHWLVDGVNVSTATTLTVNNITTHKNIQAYYKAKPGNGYKNASYDGNAGDYITLNWDDHPDSNVTEYEIWRRVRHNGVTGAAVCIATVNRGTTTYTDYEYTYTTGYSDDLLWYDVRAYYSPNGSYADAEFVAVYGKMELSKQSDDKAAAKTTENLSIAPTEYSLGSYPNPFNPTTVIRYTMPEAGQVSLKVYNILSQEVANLVESNQSAGVHQVNFNASHLPTGIYIARLQAGAKVMTAKLQLVK